MNGQCGWMVGCIMFAILHHKSSATSTSTRDTQQQQQQQQQSQESSTKHRKAEADTEYGVTCYTCVNVSDNAVCNRFAIDHPCPKGELFCHTLHIMDSHGESVVVNKKCADSVECSAERVGCLQIDSQLVCVSCCDEMYCNISVPTNSTSVFYTSTNTELMSQSVRNSSAANTVGSDWLMSTLIIFMVQTV